jgi:branched-chain amino acid transport system permease protein
MTAPHPVDVIARRHRLRWPELLPWIAVVGWFFAFDDLLELGTQIMITVIFAISLDLILGYAGIVTLGHAAFFGLGAYTAGILAANGWGEPVSGLAMATIVAALGGFASGYVVLRAHGLTLIMLTLTIVLALHEAANRMSWLTGGADGLSGIAVWPLFGRFEFDLWGRTSFWYAATAALLCWLVARRIVHSAFGRALTGIRENAVRMHAIGAPVFLRQLIVYTIAAGLAGLAGALLVQTTQAVALTVITFERSGAILIMLVLGGVGRLYGAFVGVPIYMLAQDWLSKLDPVYWYFWVGLILVLVVMFARGGVMGLVEAALAKLRRRT